MSGGTDRDKSVELVYGGAAADDQPTESDVGDIVARARAALGGDGGHQTMSDFTPTTEVVRDLYDWAATEKCLPGTAYDEHRAHFDRWLAAHDREVAARALREAAEAAFFDGEQDRTLHGYYVLQQFADRIEKGEDDV